MVPEGLRTAPGFLPFAKFERQMKGSSYFTLGARNSLDFKLSQWEEEKQSPEQDQDIQLNKPQYEGPKVARFPQGVERGFGIKLPSWFSTVVAHGMTFNTNLTAEMMFI